ncbi:MAG: hypothetical protein IKT32_05490 [Clostridia bacterium]|nr:hypothetical protein [Clostridia bacterium]
MENVINNIIDKEDLQFSLAFCSFYIAIYEHMTDYVCSSVEALLCDISIKDGKFFYNETESYKIKIKNRKVDKNGNTDKTKASFLWLLDCGGIDNNEYERFLECKKRRNKYAHKLSSIIFEGFEDSAIDDFLFLYKLYKKITNWWFINVDASIIGYEFPAETVMEEIQSVPSYLFAIMIDVLYLNGSETYKKIIESIKEEEQI